MFKALPISFRVTGGRIYGFLINRCFNLTAKLLLCRVTLCWNFFRDNESCLLSQMHRKIHALVTHMRITKGHDSSFTEWSSALACNFEFEGSNPCSKTISGYQNKLRRPVLQFHGYFLALLSHILPPIIFSPVGFGADNRSLGTLTVIRL